MNTLSFLAGAGAGAFVASILILFFIGRCFGKNSANAATHSADCLAELRRRNDLLEDQNEILAKQRPLHGLN